jgi:periplasmic copper chaperone A
MPKLAIAAMGAFLAASPALAQHGHGHGTPAAPRAQPAAEQRVGDLVLGRTWTRATPGGARVAGGYLTIRNTGATPDRLIGGSLEAAGRVEIHEMAMVEGVMRMRDLANGLPIAPGSTVELRPGGFHVMFMDLSRPLRQGETLRGTLVFERAGTVPVEFRVDAMGAGAAHRH